MPRASLAWLGAALALMAPALHAAPPERPPALVVVAPVESRSLAADRAYVGTIEAERRGRVGVEVAGYVESVDIEEGDAVTKGAVLAHLRTETLVLRIAEAEAELVIRQAELSDLQAGARAQEIDEARAAARGARADLDAYVWKLAAAERLREQERVTEEEVREARRMVESTRARLAGLEAALALLEAGTRPERIAQAAARVAAQEATLARLRDEKDRHDILAPFDGLVVERLVEPGTWVAPGMAVADLIDMTHLDVVVPVLEDDVAGIQVGLAVTVEVEALPGRLVHGTVHRLLPLVDRKARTLPVHVRLPGRDDERGRLLRDGMFARVHFAVGEPRPALTVPKDAIVLGGQEPVVYRVDATTSLASPVVVRLGVSDGDQIEVQGPLAAGDQVVVRGNERLYGPTPVRVADGR